MGTYSGASHKHLAPVVHVLGVVATVALIVWTLFFRGGYALTGNGVFNVHPVLMFAGFIFLSGEAILAYKTVNGTKDYQKVVHLSLQGVAILLGVVGMLAALKFHLDGNIANFYSLHSWFGIITLGLYFIQWVIGFVSFYYPGFPHSTRTELLPWHIFLGLALYVLALATAELGLLEKVTFLQKSSGLGLWSGEAMFVNSIGLVIFVFGVFVVLTAVLPNPYKEEGYRALE